MNPVSQLTTIVEEATNESRSDPPLELYTQVLALISCRVDMPKLAVNVLNKRISHRARQSLWLCYDLLEFLSYRCELSFYSQISTKEFLFKTSNLLMATDVDPVVHDRVLKAIRCWEEMFRPYEDLLPLFFQFYAGVLRKEFPIPTAYVSPYRPKNFVVNKKKQPAMEPEQTKSRTQQPPTPNKLAKSDMKTFEEIRNKILLTNEIITAANPAELVKDNALLIQMMEEIKKSEQKITEAINSNPNEKILEFALAVNDDIYITYRRYKDLQKRKKPEPFFLTELDSEMTKPKSIDNLASKLQPKQQVQPKQNLFDYLQNQPSPKKQQTPQKVQPKAKEINIFDLYDAPAQATKPQKPKVSGNIFDMLDTSEPAPIKKVEVEPSLPFDLLMGNQPTSPPLVQNPSAMNFPFSQITLQTEKIAKEPINAQEFTTDFDLKHYGQKNIIEKKITDLTDLFGP